MQEFQFAQAVELDHNGQLQFKKGKLNTLETVVQKIDYPAILFTERVFGGLRTDGSNKFKDGWKQQSGKIRDISGNVYGGDFTWDL